MTNKQKIDTKKAAKKQNFSSRCLNVLHDAESVEARENRRYQIYTPRF